MPSTAFVARLKPNRELRRVVMVAASLALLTGVTLIAHLPVRGWIRLLLLGLWLAWTVAEIGRQSRGAARVREIRLGPGSASVLSRRGEEYPVVIMSGSVVLKRLAWLRFRFPDGLICGELLRASDCGAAQWRNLQVLWRQGPGFFGRIR